MMRVVTYEDRPEDFTGLKLLLLSLDKYCPGLEVEVFVTQMDATFERWIARFDNAHLHSVERGARTGFNVKPGLLERVLEQGASEVVWVDSDVIVVRDFRRWMSAVPANSLIVAEDRFGAHWPERSSHSHSRAWGLPVGREMPRRLNSCVVRALPTHIPLLRAWNDLLGRPAYLAAQQVHWAERPSHLYGDQEVLSALLESRDFAHVPLRFMRRGKDIAHCFEYHGYPAHEMIANVVTGNLPLFVHAQGAKPWRGDTASHRFLDTSTYTLLARAYESDLDGDTSWIKARSRASRIARRMFSDDPWMSGIPLALLREIRDQRLMKTLLKHLKSRSRSNVRENAS